MVVFFGVFYIYIYFVGHEKKIEKFTKIGFLWVHFSVIVVFDDKLWDSTQLQFIINK
jgi:hypothetical protein